MNVARSARVGSINRIGVDVQPFLFLSDDVLPPIVEIGYQPFGGFPFRCHRSILRDWNASKLKLPLNIPR